MSRRNPSKSQALAIWFSPEQRRLFDEAAKIVSRERFGETVAPSSLVRELAVRGAQAIVEGKKAA